MTCELVISGEIVSIFKHLLCSTDISNCSIVKSNYVRSIWDAKHINSLASGNGGCNLKSMIFKLISRNHQNVEKNCHQSISQDFAIPHTDILWFRTKLCQNPLARLAILLTRPNWWFVNTGSGDNFVSSNNKPFLEPMLTMVYDTIYHH